MATFPLLTFARLAWGDTLGFPKEVCDTKLATHTQATIEWLTRAHDRSNGGGVSYGFSLRGGWLPAYRETTGYILTTFYRAAYSLQRPDLADRATQMARWLVSVQNADGSFSNPKYGHEGIVFDTAQDLFGLVAAWENTREEAFLHAARRAGGWLIQVADADGVWTQFEHKNTPTSITPGRLGRCCV